MPSDRYTKKPVTVEAIQYTGANLREVLDFTGKHPRWGEWFKSFEDYEAHVCSDRGVFKILTLEGTMEALPGDWIIRGVKGEHYPCKPDIFAATYTRSDLCASGQQVRARIEALIEDAMCDATVDYPAGREAGPRIEWDSDALLDSILAALTPAPQPSAATPNAQEAVPVAWTGNGSLMALADGREGFMWPAKSDAHPIPLFDHPPQPSETVAEALKPFANMINHIETDTPDDYHPSWAEFLTVGDFRRATAALRALKGGAA